MRIQKKASLSEDPDAIIKISRRKEVLVRRRYEALSIATDLMIALFFVSGSILYFWDSTAVAARWVYLVGSLWFLGRPMIRLARRLHLQRWDDDHWQSGSSYDY